MVLTALLLILIIILAIVILAETVLLIPKIIVRFAPKDIQEVVLRRPDAPRWKTALGIVLTLFLFFCVALILFFAGYDAKVRGMGFFAVFVRFLIILEGYKLFDMIAFDYVLLTRLNIFQRLFPETVGCKGYESFGFNLKSQLIKVVLFAVISSMYFSSSRDLDDYTNHSPRRKGKKDNFGPVSFLQYDCLIAGRKRTLYYDGTGRFFVEKEVPHVS